MSESEFKSHYYDFENKSEYSTKNLKCNSKKG